MTAVAPSAIALLPTCCREVAADLVVCLDASASWAPPDGVLEQTLEVTARAALYRWLSHCRHHRRQPWGQPD